MNTISIPVPTVTPQSGPSPPSDQTSFSTRYPPAITAQLATYKNQSPPLDLSPLCSRLFKSAITAFRPRLQTYHELRHWYKFLLHPHYLPAPVQDFDSSLPVSTRLLHLLPLPEPHQNLVHAAIITLEAVIYYLQSQGPAVFLSELTYYHFVILESHLPICRILYFLDEQREKSFPQVLESESLHPPSVSEILVTDIWNPSHPSDPIPSFSSISSSDFSAVVVQPLPLLPFDPADYLPNPFSSLTPLLPAELP